MKTLTVPIIHNAMDISCEETQNRRLSSTTRVHRRMVLRRSQNKDVKAMSEFVKQKTGFTTKNGRNQEETSLEDRFGDFRLYYSLVVVDEDDSSDETTKRLHGLATFYFGYSTWEGRVLFVDRLVCSEIDEVSSWEPSLWYTLADIAGRLDCTRYSWQHEGSLETTSFPNVLPDTLSEWLILHMEPESVDTFVASAGFKDQQAPKCNVPLTLDLIHETVNLCLRSLNAEPSSDESIGFRLSLAVHEDVEEIMRLVKGLAVYEKEPDAVKVTTEHYLRDGFCRHPLFYCILLDSIEDSVATRCGMAFCYLGYSFGEGHFLFLEDLYIDEKYRGKGGGKRMMLALARICQNLGCSRFVWTALDWNATALRFYTNMGATVKTGLQLSRFSGKNLEDYLSQRLSNC